MKRTKGSVNIPAQFPDIPKAIIKPKNLIALLFWKFIKLDVKIEMVKNPILESVNKETNLRELLPRTPWGKIGGEYR